MLAPDDYVYTEEDNVHGNDIQHLHDLNRGGSGMLPLVHQTGGVVSGEAGEEQKYAANTTVLEQPLDFSTLAPKYSKFVTDFIDKSHTGAPPQVGTHTPPRRRIPPSISAFVNLRLACPAELCVLVCVSTRPLRS